MQLPLQMLKESLKCSKAKVVLLLLESVPPNYRTLRLKRKSKEIGNSLNLQKELFLKWLFDIELKVNSR